MGLFDVFKKKDCEICGKEVGVFGYKKLEDGEICKDCVKLLSPFFSDRRHSTVQDIKIQLEARERNKELLKTFFHDMVLGDYYKMYIQTIGGVPSTFAVSGTSDYKEENADLIPFTMVSSCTPDIRENRSELKHRNSEGEQVSYSPPRYEYRYDFYVELDIQSCSYIDKIRFKLNSLSVELETVIPAGRALSFRFDPMLYPEYRKYKAMLDEICQVVSCGQRKVPYMAQQAPVQTVGNRNAAVMPGFRQAPVVQSTPVAQAAPAADASWVCECCGSENTGKFCPGCGSAKPAPTPTRPAGSQWTCLCGTANTGRFCSNCGSEQVRPEDIECSECSWTAEPGTATVPTFCPNCGKRFGTEDIR